MADKKYLGNATENTQYDIINGTICVSDLAKEDLFEYEGKKYLRISIGRKKEVKYGKTHSIWVNEYTPDNPKQEQAPAARPPKSLEEDLPF